MQHYDGATRLFDVTSSLDVALYFAASGHGELAGVVYSYRVNPDMRVSIGEQPDGREPDWCELTDRCRGGRPLLVKPQGYEPRIVAQHGAFVMTSLDGSLAQYAVRSAIGNTKTCRSSQKIQPIDAASLCLTCGNLRRASAGRGVVLILFPLINHR